MNPINNFKDAVKFVYQNPDPDVRSMIVNQPTKPFNIEAPDKAKEAKNDPKKKKKDKDDKEEKPKPFT